jgi:hypothetical protein
MVDAQFCVHLLELFVFLLQFIQRSFGITHLDSHSFTFGVSILAHCLFLKLENHFQFSIFLGAPSGKWTMTDARSSIAQLQRFEKITEIQTIWCEKS